MADTTFFEVLESDLRGLCAESYRPDNLATQITGWLSHTDYPQLKEASERAAMKLRTIPQDRSGLAAVRNSKEILRPFLLVLEFRNPKLIGHALAAIQRLLANNAVSPEGRSSIIQAMQQVEKCNDDMVKLKTLQTALTLLQSPGALDNKEDVGMVLSVCFRAYGHNRTSPTVSSTAGATIRQAVAIVFDHAGSAASSSKGADNSPSPAAGAAAGLLQDVSTMCGGKPAAWLKSPILPRLFLLELMESILLHRMAAFQCQPALGQLLNDEVCPQLAQLGSLALHPDVEPASSNECKLILRCMTAALKRHTDSVGASAPKMLGLLLSGVSSSNMVWQRLLALQGLRTLFSDPLLLQRVWRDFDASIHQDLNAVSDTVERLVEILRAALERPDSNEVLASLNSLFVSRASGKETLPDIDAAGPQQAALLDTWVLFLSLDLLLLLVADAELLADMVPPHQRQSSTELKPAGPQPQQVVAEGSGGGASSGAQVEVIGNMCDVLWRPLLAGLNLVLSRATQESLVLALLKGYQSYIFSAGALGRMTARDGFLASLCEVAVTPTEDGRAGSFSDGGAPAVAVNTNLTSSLSGRVVVSSTPAADAPAAGSAAAAGAAAAAAAAGAAPVAPVSAPALGLRNIHALRTLFNVAHRLADTLGPSWVYVVEVLNTLEAVLATGKEPAQESADTGALPSELFILATAANQLFQSSHRMSTDALVSLLSALTHVSMDKLPVVHTGGAGGVPRLAALNRVVEVMLANADRMQDLWGIFLAHVVELIHSGTAQIRAAAIDALDRTITGTLSAYCLPYSDTSSSSLPRMSSSASDKGALSTQSRLEHSSSSPRRSQLGTGASPVLSAEAAADVEHMMLVALESMYKEEREPDVRQGLLRVVQHVLQRHGDHMTRGWVPVLRLLEAVPSWEDVPTINLGFQCVELVCGDFFTSMPKEHLERTLEVVHLFASQRVVINISLAAIGSLWNVTDTISRSRPAAPAAAATPTSGRSSAVGGLLSGITAAVVGVSLTASTQSLGEAEAASTSSVSSRPASSSTTPGPAAAGVPGGAGRHDLSDAVCTELLLKVFQHLRQLSVDVRPEVRNSGVRTLLLAIGSQAQRCSAATWRHCLWDILFPLLSYVHMMGNTSSSQESERVELGKENGRSVHLLTHHSRNSEQKQWDETTVLALNGLSKVLRANMASILVMAGFVDKWNELMTICTQILTSGRKAVAVAAAQLVTGVLQVIRRGDLPESQYAWKRTVSTLDASIVVMAQPSSPVPLQARSELLTGLAAAYQAQKQGGFDLEDTEMLLSWCAALARHPLGVDDVTPVPGVLPPVQKLVLQVLGHLSPVAVQAAWPCILSTLAGFLCPLEYLQQQQQQQQGSSREPGGELSGASVQGAPAGGSGATSTSSGSGFQQYSQQQQQQKLQQKPSSPLSFLLPATSKTYGACWPATAEPRHQQPAAQPVGLLSPLFMGRIITLLASLWKNFAPYQHRAAKFSEVAAALTECMALRHVAPQEDLWAAAAAAFCEVTAAGLPAVNICFVNHQAAPADTWEVLATGFECFLFGDHIPEELMPQQTMEDLEPSSSQSTSSQHQQESEATSTPAPTAAAAAAEPRPSAASGGGASSSTTAEAPQQELQQSTKPRKRTADRQAADSASAPSLERQLVALQTQLLESLTDNVLTACASASQAAKWRLASVVTKGAELPPGWPFQGPGTPGSSSSSSRSGSDARSQERFRQLCLQKLFQLCARGSEGHGSNKCHLEVAQLTVAPLVDRCATALRLYGSLVAQQPDLQPNHPATSEVVAVLESLLELHLDYAVLDALLAHYPMHPSVQQLLQHSHGSMGIISRRSSSGSVSGLLLRQQSPAMSGGSSSGGQLHPPQQSPRPAAGLGVQTHLVVLYEPLVQCMVTGDLRVRMLLQQLLLVVGQDLQLLSAR